jgi:hypothetical protein
MKYIIFLILSIALSQTTLAQDSIQKRATLIINRIDSIVRAVDKTELVEKIISGSLEPFSGVNGIAFLDPAHKEIRKMELTVLTTLEKITYYCLKNDIQVIMTPQALYYRVNNKYFVFHCIRERELLTDKQLELQNEFLKNTLMLLFKY